MSTADSHPIPARGETTPTCAGTDYELATHDRWHEWRLDHPEELGRIVERLGFKNPKPPTASLPVEPAGTPLSEAADRLRAFIRTKAPGGCRVLSVGDACDCPLCDVDRLAALTSEVSTLQEAVDRAEEDAERWRYVSRYLAVMQDLTDDVDFVYGFNTNEICAPAHGHTVESLVDHCRAARRDGAP